MTNWELTGAREIAKLGIRNWTTPQDNRIWPDRSFISKAQDMTFSYQKGTTVEFLRTLRMGTFGE